MALGFSRVELRTTDVQGAQSFYRALLGQAAGRIIPLSQQAIANGAPPHWVGFVQVPSLDACVEKLLDANATIIGPQVTLADGTVTLTLKGPGGAVIGITTGGDHQSPEAIGFYQLITPEAANVIRDYGSIFAWKVCSTSKSPSGMVAHMIGGEADEAPTGMVIDGKDLPGSHPHWLYYFRVPTLQKAVQTVRGLGGDVVGIYELPHGNQVAVCHDPQGAAFAMCE